VAGRLRTGLFYPLCKLGRPLPGEFGRHRSHLGVAIQDRRALVRHVVRLEENRDVTIGSLDGVAQPVVLDFAKAARRLTVDMKLFTVRPEEQAVRRVGRVLFNLPADPFLVAVPGNSELGPQGAQKG